MEEPILSIIIPTHKRAQILRRCLEHIEHQTVKDRLEVIVVSDRPDAETAALFQSTTYHLPPTTYLEIPKSHQGVARNRGVEKAKGKLTLFIGDDIFLAPHACELHLQAHYNLQPITYNLAILGFTTWDPSVGITPVMRWLEESGWQFGYPMIQKYAHGCIPESMQYRFTYTSHISLPTEIARKFPFREDVHLYGWEDIEWGWRLKEVGVKLFYEPNARALHHHHVTVEDSLKRMETLGKSAVMMDNIRPELHLVPRGLKKWKYRIASLLPTMQGHHAQAFLLGTGLPTGHITL